MATTKINIHKPNKIKQTEFIGIEVHGNNSEQYYRICGIYDYGIKLDTRN